jgi:hypothetical protein
MPTGWRDDSRVEKPRRSKLRGLKRLQQRPAVEAGSREGAKDWIDGPAGGWAAHGACSRSFAWRGKGGRSVKTRLQRASSGEPLPVRYRAVLCSGPAGPSGTFEAENIPPLQ